MEQLVLSPIQLSDPLSAVSFFAQNDLSLIENLTKQKKDAATIGAMLRFCTSFQRFLKPHKISSLISKMLQKNFVIELYFVIEFVKCKITIESKRSASVFLRNTISLNK